MRSLTAVSALGAGICGALLGAVPLTAAPSVPRIEWQRAFGGASWEEGCCVRPTPDGGMLIGGTSASPSSPEKPSTNYGNADFLVARLNADGNTVWEKTFGGTNLDYLADILALSDGGWLLGGFSQSPPSGNKTSPHFGSRDYWIVRIDADGNKLWERSYGTAAMETLRSLARIPAGGFILAGQIYPTSASGITDWWILRIDETGDVVWEKTFGGSGFEEWPRAHVNSAGEITIAGYSSSTDGSRASVLPGMNHEDYWLVRLKSDGSLIWEKSYGGIDSDYLYSSAPVDGGGTILAGSSSSSPSGNKTTPFYGAGQQWGDYWVVRTGDDGDIVWQRTFGGSGVEFAGEVIQLHDGGFAVGGASVSVPSGNKTAPLRDDSYYTYFGDYWVVRMDARGEMLWDESVGGSDADILTGLAETADHGLVLIGQSGSPADGNKTVANRGQSDIWVVKLAPPAAPATLEVLPQTFDAIRQNGFQLILRGTPGRTYQLEYSDDLNSWHAFATVAVLSVTTTVSDTNTAHSARRFYRAMGLP